MAFINKNVSTMAMPSGMNRMGQFPLDMSSVYYDEASLKAYAESGAIAYVGQIVSLVDETNGKVTVYSIQNLAGDLKEVGTIPVGDEKTIDVDAEGKISLANIESLVFERDILGEDEEPTGEKEEVKYQALLTKDGLVWVEPSKTTVEGLATLIDGLSKEMTGVKGRLDEIEKDYLVAADLNDYAKTEDLPVNVSDLTNDAGYLVSADLADYAKTADVVTNSEFEAFEEANDEAIAAARTGAVSDVAAVGYALASNVEATYATKEELGDVDDKFGDYLTVAAYNTDKEALDAEDEAIRAIAEDAQTKVDTFMGTIESSTEVVDTLSEIINLINSEDAELSTALMTEINKKADKTTVEAIDDRVEALENKPFDTYATKSEVEGVNAKFADYTTTAVMNGKFDEKVDKTSYATDKAGLEKAIEDAEAAAIVEAGKLADAAKADAITEAGKLADAAQAAAEGKVSALETALDARLDDLEAINHDSFATKEALNTVSGVATDAQSRVGIVEGKIDEITSVGGEPNVLERIKVNGVTQEIEKDAEGKSLKSVNISVPTKFSDIEDNSGFDARITAAQSKADSAAAAAGTNAAAIDQLRADLTTEQGKITNLQSTTGDHATRIQTVENTVNGHTTTINSHTESITGLTNAVATKAEQSALNGAVERISANETAIDNRYTKEEANALLADKADKSSVYTKGEADNLLNAKADTSAVYTKEEINATVATLATKTELGNQDTALKALITAEETRATGKEAELLAAIQKNAEDIGKIDFVDEDELAAAVEVETNRAVAKENELAGLISANSQAIAGNTAAINSILGNEDEIDLNSIAELAAWITEHGTEAEGMTEAIEANAAAIKVINETTIPAAIASANGYTDEVIAALTKTVGDNKTAIEGTVSELATLVDNNKTATDAAIKAITDNYKVKDVDGTSLALNTNGVASVKAVSTDLLTQGAEELIFCAGDAGKKAE